VYVSKERNSHGCGGRGSLDCSFGNLDSEVVKMKLLVKILGKLMGAILYPFTCMLLWFIAFVAVIAEEIEKLMEEDV
jgi:hypothetical protein